MQRNRQQTKSDWHRCAQSFYKQLKIPTLNNFSILLPLLLFLFFGLESQAQENWNIQLNQSSLDCSANQVCYEVELQNAGGGSWTLGDQNYRFFFDGDLMTVTSVTSLLPSTFYGAANIDQNIKISGQGQEPASPLDDIDDNLGFLDFSIVQTDKSNPPAATQIGGAFVPTAEICVAVDASVINDPTGSTCLSIYHSRPSTAGAITNQYTVFSENDAPGSTSATTGVGYDDLTPADGSDACLGLSCITSPCANQGGDTDNDGVCDNSDCAPNDPTLPTTPGTACDDSNANTVMDVILSDGCTCAGTPMSMLNNWDIQIVLDEVDCANNEACYIVEVQSASGTNWALGDQNYRLFFDGDLMTVTSVTSLLPNTFYSGATIDQNIKVSGQGQETASPLDDIDDNLGFLDFNMVQIDKSNPPNASQAVPGVWTSTAEICVAVDASVIDDFTGGTCLSFYHSRPATAGSFTNQYTTITENDAPNSTIMTMGANYNDLTSANGTDACLGPLCTNDCDDGLTEAEICAICNTTSGTAPSNPLCVLDCDGDTINNAAECDNGTDPTDPDTDGDGNPDNTDPNPLVPTAVDDATTAPVNVVTTVDILANDNYLANNDPNNLGTTTITNLGTGTAGGTIVFDPNDGTFDYTPLPAEAGMVVTVDYQVCNNESGSLVCDDATVTITVPACLAQAGTLTADEGQICMSMGQATISATPNGDINVPANYEVVYVLTSGTGLVIEQAGGSPSFTVNTSGDYTIHTVVAETNNSNDPNFLDLSTIVLGTTTGFDVNSLLIQGGGSICGSLDVAGAPITVLAMTDPQCGPCANAGGDSDNDGVCDNDDCAPLNPNLPAPVGSSCNDNNPNTVNDIIKADGCTCQGTPQTIDCDNISITTGSNSIIVSGLDGAPVSSVQIFNSSWQQEFSCFADCDATETISVTPGSYYVYIKFYTANYQLVCQENLIVTVTGGGSVCNNVTNGGTIGIGNSCDNSINICGASGTAPIIGNCVSATGGSGTLQYVWLKNEVNCFAPTVTIDQILANPNISNWKIIPGETGASLNPGAISTNTCYTRCARRANCNDYTGEANIVSITVDPNCGGCTDNDNDGVCVDDDCDDNNPNLPALVGSSCNDGNSNTINDVYQADGCTCQGTPQTIDCANISISAGNGTIVVTGLDGAPISSLQIFNAQWQQQFSCFADCGATETVNVAAGTYYVYAKYYTANYQLICENQKTVTVTTGGGCTDNDNDGVCVADDCDDNNPNVPAAVGSPCDDGNANTTNDVYQADGCTCAGTPVSTCDNVNFGGKIGFGAACPGSFEVCSGENAPVINSCQAPSGGSGQLEIVWLKNEAGCSPPNVTLAQIIANPNISNWTIIPGATNLSFDPGVLTTNTCYLRCARRAGCDQYLGESNIVQITIDQNCGGGGDPDCADISISAGNGTIVVTGLDGAPVSSLQIFNAQWQQQFSCFADCGATETVNVAAGTYYVYAKYYTANYQLICENQKTVTVTTGGGCTDNDNDGVCANDDCDDNNPNVPAAVGSSCNDNNPNTTGDVIQADGCSCAGTPVGGGDPDCNDISITTGNQTIVVSGLDGAPISSLQIFNAQWQQEFSCFANCGATETVNVAAGTYYVYAKYYTAGYQLICQENKTVTVTDGGGSGAPCNNFTTGGKIGFFSHCAPSLVYCPGNGGLGQIKSCEFPSGGSGAIEYIWLKSTVTSAPPATIADPNWTIIAGATQSQYQPSNVSQTTYFIRCARRAGCLNYTGESNIATISVDSNCNGGGGTTDPDCGDVTVSANNGNIIVTALDGAPITSVQVFTSSWANHFSCFADCGSPTQEIPASDGTYYVYVKYYTAAYSLICTVEKTINVVNGQALIGISGTNDLTFQVNQWEEHAELIWSHNKGNFVESYIVERSADGDNFEDISANASKGTTVSEVYQDYDAAPLKGDNYYRIRMKNRDGSVTYSNSQLVHFLDLVDFSLFPNPANRFVKVNLEEVMGQEVDIVIYNNLGQQLKAIHLDKVYSKYHEMDLQDLKEGYYTVWLNVPGRRAVAKKLVIGRL